MGFNTLDRRYWNDKGYRKHRYFRTYERLLRPFVGKRAVMLELGVRHGLSMLLWRDYLRNAVIHGIDLVRTPRLLRAPDPRLAYHRLDCTDRAALEREFGGLTFDLVIDDASHRLEQQKISYELLGPKVRAGGLYVVEDAVQETLEWFAEHVPGCEIVDLRGGRTWRDDVLVICRPGKTGVAT